ncbi:hypothetical protein HDV02_002198 [Globomyces sp. JEL0801]|nr:hypothetical protein HDV02_002198 [Globomyces sp. JEL0801]
MFEPPPESYAISKSEVRKKLLATLINGLISKREEYYMINNETQASFTKLLDALTQVDDEPVGIRYYQLYTAEEQKCLKKQPDDLMLVKYSPALYDLIQYTTIMKKENEAVFDEYLNAYVKLPRDATNYGIEIMFL